MATPGKIGMWIFLISDAFSFGGLLIAEGILYAGRHPWRQPGEALLAGQFQEWFVIWGPGLLRAGLVFGQSPRASTFYVITGYPGLDVLVGVAYILAILVGYLRGHVTERQIELLGLYWCFVYFVWVFIFSFVYLLPSLSGA